MTITEVQEQIKSKNLKSFYVFYGEEWKIQEIYIENMARVKNLPIKHIDTISEVYSKIVSPSMFVKPALYVVRDDKDLMAENLFDGVNMNKNIVVLVVSSLDKRSKFYRVYKDTIVEFSFLNEALLRRYVKKEINLSYNNIGLLMTLCNNNYGQILLEIDKIKNYPVDLSDDDKFKVLVESGTIYSPPKDAVFEFVDNVLFGNTKKSYELLNHCYGIGEATLVMLSVLYNNAKQLLQVQSCESSNIEKSTGLTSWQVKNAKKYVGKWRNGDLVYLMRLIREVERGIKTGIYEDSYLVDYVLAKFYGG